MDSVSLFTFKNIDGHKGNIFIHYLQNQQILHSLLKVLFLLHGRHMLAVESAFPQENLILLG